MRVSVQVSAFLFYETRFLSRCASVGGASNVDPPRLPEQDGGRYIHRSQVYIRTAADSFVCHNDDDGNQDEHAASLVEASFGQSTHVHGLTTHVNDGLTTHVDDGLTTMVDLSNRDSSEII